MAIFDVDNELNEQDVPISNLSNDNMVDSEVSMDIPKAEDDNVYGLSEAEKSDPTLIQTVISDKKTPIVVLFGPPACGKTMLMIRIARYLKQLGYEVKPKGDFRPQYDSNYESICNNFNTLLNSNFAAESTNRISFMLLEVLDEHKNRVCQILEAPGEHYHNPNNLGKGFLPYIENIINSPNRKIWAIMAELNWNKNVTDYIDRIAELRKSIEKKDSILFICNKVDLTPFVRGKCDVNIKQLKQDFRDEYIGLFNMFTYRTLFGKKHAYKFVPFQTGSYTRSGSGRVVFSQGDDYYPKMLWNTIRSFGI